MNIAHTILATVGSIIVMFAISKLLGNKQIHSSRFLTTSTASP